MTRSQMSAPLDPFDVWSGMSGAWNSGAMFVEMMQASCAVIHSRSRTMLAAGSDPMHGDYAELGRMLPEKIEAVMQSGAVAMADARALQDDMLAAFGELTALAFNGATPTSSALSSLAGRSSRMMQRAAGSTDRMMAPFHHGATDNARRLAPAASPK